MDEECELRDLVAKTLENNGTLAKIRAELRASVFLALEEQDFSKTFVNKPLQEFVSTTEGALITCLVREFLECFGLDVTLSVFDPETGLGKDYELTGRKSLIQQLGVNTLKDTGTHKPLLAHLVQLEKPVSKSDRVLLNEDKSQITLQKNTLVMDTIKVSEPITNTTESGKTFKIREPVAKLSESVPSWTQEDRPTLSHVALSANKEPLTGAKMDENKKLQGPVIDSSTGAQSSFPPLRASSVKQLQSPHLSNLNSDSDLEQLKSMIDLGLDYEEDFNSSGSGQEKSQKSLPATDSDIEEEIEDIDEMSNISAGEDLTADKSLS